MFKVISRNLHSPYFSEKYNKLLLNYLSKINIDEIEHSLSIRNDKYKTNLLFELLNQFNSGNTGIKNEILKMINELPNLVSFTTPVGNESDSKILKVINHNENYSGDNAQKIGKALNQLRIDDVVNGAEARAYYLNGDLANLERAILRYTINTLLSQGFKLISVPDIIDQNIVNMCGFTIDPNRNQIYNVVTKSEQIQELFQFNNLKQDSFSINCLSGTSEMALAAFLSNTVFGKQTLPIKLCAMSRCYRREVSDLESHLYRVHQFNKVEMFCVTSPSESCEMLDYIVDIQEKLFLPLGFGYRILDIASEDLGNPAYKKIDIESWMPGENRFGEISSASNCTDYQSRRLNIFYENDNSDLNFVHTLNGTGCAIPRLLKTIVETNCTEKGHVVVPQLLRKYMGNIDKITRQFPPHKINWIHKLPDNK